MRATAAALFAPGTPRSIDSVDLEPLYRACGQMCGDEPIRGAVRY